MPAAPVHRPEPTELAEVRSRSSTEQMMKQHTITTDDMRSGIEEILGTAFVLEKCLQPRKYLAESGDGWPACRIKCLE